MLRAGVSGLGWSHEVSVNVVSDSSGSYDENKFGDAVESLGISVDCLCVSLHVLEEVDTLGWA